MAIKAAVDEFLKKTVTNADEYKRAVELYEKYPGMQENFLADADYQRQVQATAAARKAAEAAETAAKAKEAKNVEWWNTNSPVISRLETERDQLQAKLTELEAGRGAADDAGATPAQLKKYDAVMADLQKKIDAGEQMMAQFRGQDGKFKKLVDEEQLNRSADGFGQFLMDSVDILREHDRKFPDMPLKSKDLYKFMTDNKLTDVQVTYDKMTQEKRQTEWEKQIREDQQKKTEAELMAKMNRLPIDSGATGPVADGPLKLFINRKQESPDVPADGSGRLAAIAAQEMRSEGKS